MADSSCISPALDNSQLLAVREDLARVRIDVSRMFDERLDRARELRVRILGVAAKLRVNDCLEFSDDGTEDGESLARGAWMEERPSTPFEQTFRLADEVLDEKDSEITRLKARLQEYESNHQAQQAMLTNDQIEEERAKLHHLHEEWREKTRQAEIEISLERARITREREQLTEKLCRLEAEIERLNPKAGDKGGRRWLHQLGLNEPGE